MLGRRLALDPGTTAAAGCTWFGGLLTIGDCSAAGTLLLRRVDVRGDGGVEVFDTNLPFGADGGRQGNETAALAAWNDALWIAFGRLGRDWFLTATADGQAVSPPVALPLPTGVVGPSALAAHAGGLALLWTEAFGAAAHLLTTADGQTFADTPLPFRARRGAAVLHQPQTGRLLFAYAPTTTNGVATVEVLRR